MRCVILLLVLASCCSAVVATGGGSSGGGVALPGETSKSGSKKKPVWVDDPTEGGKQKAVVISWANGADRDTQRKARKEAIENLLATFKLPPSTRTKDMDTWTDGSGGLFILLVAR